MGWHRPGIVAVCAWEAELSQVWDADFVVEHREVLDRLGVEPRPCFDEHGNRDLSALYCHFTETSARGFQLMHVLLHELGHHHDRMTTRSQREASRGEAFAETYANRYASKLWNRYYHEFGW